MAERPRDELLGAGLPAADADDAAAGRQDAFGLALGKGRQELAGGEVPRRAEQHEVELRHRRPPRCGRRAAGGRAPLAQGEVGDK